MPSTTLRFPTLCECGCGKPTPIATRTRRHLGHVRGEPIRYCHNHFRRAANWDRIEEDATTHCWNWQGSCNNYGYGQIRLDGRSTLVHRAYYEWLVGPIPGGCVLDHLCRNPRCCNPGHVEPVTQRENILRGRGPVAIHAAKTHCVNGHEFDEANTRIEKDGSRKCRACDRERHRRYREPA